MQVSRHYSRSPITEAIIDLRVTLPEGFSVDKLTEIYTSIRDNFPTKEPMHTSSLMFEAFAPPLSPELVSVILDFDLFREQIWQSDDEEIWRFLEELRHRKNQVFNASITEKTKELIA